MSLVLEIRRRGRHIVGPILWALVVGYFLFHAVQGERGVLVWAQFRQQVAQAEHTRDELARIRARLDARVSALRSDNLDPDLLDERARIVAGLGAPGEIVIFGAAERFPD